MNNVNQLVSFYHMGFIVLITLSIIFFLSAVLMFFKFDIVRIWTIRSGRAVKKSIKEMEEATAMSGKLRADKPYVPREKSKKLSKTTAAPLIRPTPPGQNGRIIESPLPRAVIVSPSEEIREGAASTGILKNDKSVKIGTFMISKTVLLIHTDEVI